MSDEKKKRIRGFAGIVSRLIEPLNENEKFKKQFKDTELKILLNVKDGRYACILIIDNGKIYVEGMKNNPKKNLKKKVVGWDGFLQTKTSTFLEILEGEDVLLGKVIRKILTGRIKIRGIKNVLILLKLFRLK